MSLLSILLILGQVFLFTLALGVCGLFLWENKEITEQIREREGFFR